MIIRKQIRRLSLKPKASKSKKYLKKLFRLINIEMIAKEKIQAVEDVCSTKFIQNPLSFLVYATSNNEKSELRHVPHMINLF